MADLLERLSQAVADRYAVKGEIGRGGMATVFLAEDLKHGRQVALKVLHPELAASVGGDRFLREIKIAAGLEHPHILSLIDSGEAGGLFFYVMPYVDGESLRERLRRERQLPIEEAVRIGQEVADGLGHAHRQGVVHRDIKPANVMLSDGHALIADFGVAKAVGSDGTALTRTGMAVGTPAYMSPEQASGAEDVDARSDVYALGCVMYEMLAGEPPLTGATPQAIAGRRLTETATALPVIRETVPGGLDRVVSKALARTSVDRYASGSELAEALAAPEVWEETAPKLKFGRRTLDAAIAVVLLGAGLFLAQFFTGRGGSAVETDPDLIAVLPLVSAAGGDTALTKLGHEVAARISADLDGIGSIRTANYASIRATEEATAGTPEDAAGWAHAEIGAGQVIQGSLTMVRADEVGIDLALYDSERTLLARASFVGAPGEPWMLADSLAWRLLDQMWTAGSDNSRDFYYRVLLRGRPFTAVREYILADGWHWDWERGNREKAEAYERAYRADTTLWMASFMNDYISRPGYFVNPGPRDTVVVNAWREHVEDLPPAYQLWVEAWDLPFGSESTFLRLEEMLQPSGTIARGNFGPILHRYADWLFHAGRAYGYTIEYTVDQMEAAIDRGWGAELHEHLYEALGIDSVASQRWVDRWVARRGAEDNPDRYRFIRLLTSRLGGARDSALADSVVQSWTEPGTEQIGKSWWVGLPDLGVELGRSLSALELEPEYKVGLLSPLAISWAIRGAWDSALVAAARRDRESKDEAARFGYRLSVLGESLGELQSGAADEFRPGAQALVDKYGDEYPEDRLWHASVDGLLTASRKDAAGLADARGRAEAVRDDWNPEQDPVSYVVRSLRAYELDLAGDRRRATDSLYAVEWDHPQSPRPGGFSHVRGINRLTVGRWLLAAGDTVRAQKMITALQFGMMEDWTAHLTTGPAYLELARIEEARGQAALARDYYEQFLRRYDMPVEAHRPMVEEVRAAYERLGGDAGRFD